MIAVGGTQLDIAGSVEAGGQVADERVWNGPSNKETGAFGAGGGGHSQLFPMPRWQRRLGLRGPMAEKPDIALLAGSPYYTKVGGGTSGGAPLAASGYAVVLSSLRAKGVAPPRSLRRRLYDPERRQPGTSFDVTHGSNDLFDVGCCTATRGYDTASGLGAVRFDQLEAALASPTLGLFRCRPDDRRA